MAKVEEALDCKIEKSRFIFVRSEQMNTHLCTFEDSFCSDLYKGSKKAAKQSEIFVNIAELISM
jgi:hypothetical protein